MSMFDELKKKSHSPSVTYDVLDKEEKKIDNYCVIRTTCYSGVGKVYKYVKVYIDKSTLIPTYNNEDFIKKYVKIINDCPLPCEYVGQDDKYYYVLFDTSLYKDRYQLISALIILRHLWEDPRKVPYYTLQIKKKCPKIPNIAAIQMSYIGAFSREKDEYIFNTNHSILPSSPQVLFTQEHFDKLLLKDFNGIHRIYYESSVNTVAVEQIRTMFKEEQYEEIYDLLKTKEKNEQKKQVLESTN